MILEKMRSCLWKLRPGFWTYCWIRLLGPSDPNVSSRPQTSRSRNFLRFCNFIGFISRFLRKWGPVCKNLSQGSGLIAGYVFLAQVTQIYFLGPRPQGQDILGGILWFYWINLMIIEKMRSSLWKLEPGFLTNGLISPLLCAQIALN